MITWIEEFVEWFAETAFDYFDDQVGYGETGDNIYIGDIPNSPDQIIVFNEYGGPITSLTLHAGTQFSDVQVIVRSSKASGLAENNLYTEASGLMNSIHRTFRQVNSSEPFIVAMDHFKIKSCIAIQQPAFLEKDDKGRVLFVCNYRFQIDQIAQID